VHKGRVTQQLKSHNTANSNLVKNNFEELTQQQIDDEYFGKLQITTTSNERKGIFILFYKSKIFTH
jgi:hypothetical protein